MNSKVKEEAERDATRILCATWGSSTPVEPVGIAKDLGVRVLEGEFDGETLGVLLKESNADPVILLNRRDSMVRRRLTCAHVLGHYIKRPAELDEYARIDLRNRRTSSGDDQEEAYASEFSACLLMPEDEVRTFADLGLDDLEMALRFVVPRDAMKFRLIDLGLVQSAVQGA